jgi:hypothetical protein
VRIRCRECENGVLKTTQEGDREIDREYMMSVIASSDRLGTIETIMGRWRWYFHLNMSHWREREHEVVRHLSDSDSNWVERTWDVQSKNNQHAGYRSAVKFSLTNPWIFD